jgi:predicted RNase H-like nuclease (RuvC/YqgF family)
VKSNYYKPCSQPRITAERIEPLVWGEVCRVLKDPKRVIEYLEHEGSEAKQAVSQAEGLLLEKSIADAENEEQRYLKQYGKGIIAEKILLREVERVKKYRQREEAKLARLQQDMIASEDAGKNIENISETLETLSRNLDTADYEVKRLALQVLDVKVIITGNEAYLTGSIPTNESSTNYANSGALW